MTEPGPQENREEVLYALRDRQTFTAGCAVLLFIAGILSAPRWRTLHLPFMLGGLILLIGQIFDVESSQVVPYLYGVTADAGTTRNLLHVSVSAAGTLLLLVYGYSRWERSVAPK